MTLFPPGVTSTVKQLLQEACIQVLSSKRRLDILRDAMDAKAQGRTYNIVFCGVNGVGKSTNLAKVSKDEQFDLYLISCMDGVDTSPV